MKSLIASARFLVMILILSNAAAAHLRAAEQDRVDKLLDLLVNKGVVTADEAKELKVAVDTQKPTAAPVMAKNNMQINGYLKAQSLWMKNGTAQNLDTFRVRHARLTFSGSSSPNYSWKFGFAMERTSDPVLLDALITYKISPKYMLTMGQFKLPISRESLQSANTLDFMERASFIDQFRPANARDIGVMLDAKISKKWNFALGAFNGNGKNTTDSNDQPMWASRINGTFPVGKVTIEPEMAYIHAPSEKGSATRSAPIEISNLSTASFAPFDKGEKQWGMAAFYGGYNFKYEYLMGRFKPKSSAVSTVIADGESFTLNKKLSKRFAGHMRTETYDPNLRTTTASDINWTTLGLSFDPQKSIRYDLNYVWKKEAAGSDKNNLLGLQLIVNY